MGLVGGPALRPAGGAGGSAPRRGKAGPGAAVSAELLASQAALSQRLLAFEDAAHVPQPLDGRPSGSQDARRYVKNLASACVHVALLSSLELPREAWATRCDWRFGGRPREFCYAVPDEGDPAFRFLCEKCFPGARLHKGRRTEGRRSPRPHPLPRPLSRPPRGELPPPPCRPGLAQHAAEGKGTRPTAGSPAFQ